ncbi:acyl carrier protein [uncultured Tateyamaria sp.]|uniref:acyl carrier protein n=1 Tax=uncultured Tateyamaria sp. TaxID=455651 RepID=UPI0026018B06|nr:phosphopantetheine-binding protein [uncultured Tateyamaria sp.]
MSTSDHVLQAVIRAFRRAFPDAHISGQSDFFDLGGDSLALISLCTDLEGELRIDVAPASLLYHPTVEDFAAAIGGMSAQRTDLNASN